MQCFNLIEKEPFWKQGRHILINWLEKNDELNLALHLAIEELKISKAFIIDELRYIITLCTTLTINHYFFQKNYMAI